jgi:deoxyadenosine/deoxycytidine kinase
VVCLQEPVEEWSKMKDSQGNTLFSLYYNDQKRYALAFQLQVLHTRFELLERTVKEYQGADDTLILTERDLTTDYRIFTQMLYDRGMFEEIEFRLYQQVYESYQRRLLELCADGNQRLRERVNKRIYLTTSPAVAHRRMMCRGRAEEKNVPLEYLEAVDRYHKGLFSNGTPKVLKLNGDEDWDAIPSKVFDEVVGFLLFAED